jgi:hypothetical protein
LLPALLFFLVDDDRYLAILQSLSACIADEVIEFLRRA